MIKKYQCIKCEANCKLSTDIVTEDQHPYNCPFVPNECVWTTVEAKKPIKFNAMLNRIDQDQVELYSTSGVVLLVATMHIDHLVMAGDQSIAARLINDKEVMIAISIADEES
jgi:hypothetical protein